MATKLEQKQKELIDYSFGFVKYIPYVIDLMNEITELEKQVEEQEENQEQKPIYDENYLNECIAKAKPNLSKIKDVDKALDEIRGISDITDADIEAYLNEKEMSFKGTVPGIKYSEVYRLFFTEGAKAALNGEIKHIEK